MGKVMAKAAKIKVSDHANCPIRDLITRIGDKWSMMVLISLDNADDNLMRFSELMRSINGISQRMLSTTLRYLERDGIITRNVYPEVPPRVEYSLTKRGKNLLVPVQNLVEWIKNEWPDIEKSRQTYDNRASK